MTLQVAQARSLLSIKSINYGGKSVKDDQDSAPIADRFPATDPFERATKSDFYTDWEIHRAFLAVPAQALVAQWLESFKEFPIRHKPASFNLDGITEKLMAPQPN